MGGKTAALGGGSCRPLMMGGTTWARGMTCWLDFCFLRGCGRWISSSLLVRARCRFLVDGSSTASGMSSRILRSEFGSSAPSGSSRSRRREWPRFLGRTTGSSPESACLAALSSLAWACKGNDGMDFGASGGSALWPMTSSSSGGRESAWPGLAKEMFWMGGRSNGDDLDPEPFSRCIKRGSMVAIVGQWLRGRALEKGRGGSST